MEIRRSISYPELMVSNLGDVYFYDTGKRINIIRDHGYSTRGFVVAYKYDGRFKNISVANLVYEAFIKRKKLTRNDYVEFKDSDEFNPRADNLESSMRTARVTKTKKSNDGEYSTWMGIDEVYC